MTLGIDLRPSLIPFDIKFNVLEQSFFHVFGDGISAIGASITIKLQRDAGTGQDMAGIVKKLQRYRSGRCQKDARRASIIVKLQRIAGMGRDGYKTALRLVAALLE